MATQAKILSLVNHPHSASAQLGKDAVVRDSLADCDRAGHGGERSWESLMLGRVFFQVKRRYSIRYPSLTYTARHGDKFTR